MTARVVLSCDGQEGMYPCRQAIPVGAVMTGNEARRIAARNGWTTRTHSGGVLVASTVQDLCPACTKRMQK